MTVGKNTWDLLSQLKCGKPIKIIVWRNGDYYGFGREILINPLYLTTWNSILNYLTEVLQPNFGAVRKLIYLETRKKVEQFKDLKAMGQYVAVGTNKFKYRKKAYGTEQKTHFIKREKYQEAKLCDSTESLLNFMATTHKNLRTVIYVMVSGRIYQEACKVVLTQLDLTHWNMVLKYLAKILDVPEGIECLCAPSGHIIESGICLEHGGLYIALPFMAKFIKKDYVGQFHQQMALKRSKPASLPKKRLKISLKIKKEKPKIQPDIKHCVSKKCLTEECLSKKVPRVDVRQVAKFVDNLIAEGVKKLEKNDLPASVLKAYKLRKGAITARKYNSFLANFEHRHNSSAPKTYTTFAEIAERNQVGSRESSELSYSRIDLHRSSSLIKKNVNFGSSIEPNQVLADEASVIEVEGEDTTGHKQSSSHTRMKKFSSLRDSIYLPRSEALLSSSKIMSLQSVKEDEDDAEDVDKNKMNNKEFGAIKVQVNNCCKQYGYLADKRSHDSVINSNTNRDKDNFKKTSHEEIRLSSIAIQNTHRESQDGDGELRSIFKIQDLSETSSDNRQFPKPSIPKVLKMEMVESRLSEVSDNSVRLSDNNNNMQSSKNRSIISDISKNTEKCSDKSMDMLKDNIEQSQEIISSSNQITKSSLSSARDDSNNKSVNKINSIDREEKTESINYDKLVETSESNNIQNMIITEDKSTSDESTSSTSSSTEKSQNTLANYSENLVKNEKSQSTSSPSDKMTMFESNKDLVLEKVDKSSQSKESTQSVDTDDDSHWNCLKDNIISVACSEICIRICKKK
ncbi:hypothetical protein GWI33_007163 [Rhynchophorus ferrugineus]|uniref:Doublecortin domain-containing protein n=1 Tax=Rhynchophorus ferrugineus TaxID=354439 RepID=A0A834IW52_RHYFE|nr:hypothetical protein GWI33_007163 [Rhynchophorus ferrugineus]